MHGTTTKSSQVLWCLLILTVLCAVQAAAGPGGKKPSDSGNQTGEIVGVIDYCGPGGATGFLVHIPGESFTVVTGPSGDFRFRDVPEGTWALRVASRDHPPQMLPPIVVERNSVTNLGTIVVCPDADGDGYAADTDCNDNNPTTHPGAEELCDGFDNNCDGAVDEGCPTCTDQDNDSYYAQAGCGSDVDCDDSEPTVSPGAPEICDGEDNDCDTLVDEGFDADGDGYTTCGGDCDDSDPLIHPEAEETCFDERDNNCNGEVDEGCPTCEDLDDDGYFAEPGCGTAVDCDDLNTTVFPGAEELCDGLDNDCDGDADEGCPACEDLDDDGYFAEPGCGTEVDCDSGFKVHDGGCATALWYISGEDSRNP